MKKTVYYVEGDGIGPEIWAASRPLFDKALSKAYNQAHCIEWKELLVGEKAYKETGDYLPESTIKTLRGAELAIKGPLTTPIGGGFRSLNVALRQILDLYACIRPIRYFKGISSPLKKPELVDMIIFRENIEDLYAGIEFQSNTPEAAKIINFLADTFGINLDPKSGIGIKPMSEFCTKRLVRKALDYAIKHKKPSVTFVHKGNIMKYTEGAFNLWGYDLALSDEYRDQIVTEQELNDLTPEEQNSQAKEQNSFTHKVIIKDRIADNMLQQVLINPDQYSVIAAPNLNGDYLSDALAAQVGGLGLAPGVNMSDKLAFFEATHGTAPKHAGKDSANPGSVILSGAMLFEHAGFEKAAELIYQTMEKVIGSKRVPRDLAKQMDGAETVGCKEFAELLGEAL